MSAYLLDGRRRVIPVVLLTALFWTGAPGKVVPGVASMEAAGFAVQDAGPAALTFAPESLSFTWLVLENPSLMVDITNGGGAPVAITDVSASLRDAATGRQFSGSLSHPDTLPTIKPGDHGELRFDAPRLPFAGTYTGSAIIRYNGGGRVTLPFTVITRGPTFSAFHWLPLALFLLVVVVSSGLSLLAESWFGSGGGLARSQAIVALADAERALVESGRELAKVIAEAGAVQKLIQLPVTAQNIERTQSAARDARQSIDPSRDFTSALVLVRSGQLAASALVTDLKSAWQSISATEFATLCPAIEALPWPTDQATLETYRAGVRKEIDGALQRSRPAGAPGAPQPAAPMLGAQDTRTIDHFKQRVTLMLAVNRLTIGLVVVLTAYTTFYAPKPAFGVSTDYIALFLWGLGLTQAGAQIVARARSSAN